MSTQALIKTPFETILEDLVDKFGEMINQKDSYNEPVKNNSYGFISGWVRNNGNILIMPQPRQKTDAFSLVTQLNDNHKNAQKLIDIQNYLISKGYPPKTDFRHYTNRNVENIANWYLMYDINVGKIRVVHYFENKHKQIFEGEYIDRLFIGFSAFEYDARFARR